MVRALAVWVVLFIFAVPARANDTAGAIAGPGFECDLDAGICTCVGEASSTPCRDMADYCLGRMTCEAAANGAPARCTCAHNPEIPWGPGFLGGPRRR